MKDEDLNSKVVGRELGEKKLLFETFFHIFANFKVISSSIGLFLHVL